MAGRCCWEGWSNFLGGGGPRGAVKLPSSPAGPHTGVDTASALQRPRWKFMVKGETPHLGLRRAGARGRHFPPKGSAGALSKSMGHSEAINRSSACAGGRGPGPSTRPRERAELQRPPEAALGVAGAQLRPVHWLGMTWGPSGPLGRGRGCRGDTACCWWGQAVVWGSHHSCGWGSPAWLPPTSGPAHPGPSTSHGPQLAGPPSPFSPLTSCRSSGHLGTRVAGGAGSASGIRQLRRWVPGGCQSLPCRGHRGTQCVMAAGRR